MTATSERGHARLRTAGFRIAPFALVLAVACVGGVDRSTIAPTGVLGPTGGGGGGSSGGSATYAGLYKLQTVNDTVVPDTLAKDSASGTGSIGDTTRVFVAVIDSSIISLNSDSSAQQFDYVSIRDTRTASDSSFNRSISFGDTLAGVYSVSGTTVTVSIIDTVGGTHSVVTTYAATGTTLTGTVSYEIFNTDGAIAAVGQSTYKYGFTGPPLVRVVRPKSPASLSRAVARLGPRRWHPPVRAARSGIRP
jgi:hypothetical protein